METRSTATAEIARDADRSPQPQSIIKPKSNVQPTSIKFTYALLISARRVRGTNRRAMAMLFVHPSVRPSVCPSVCLSGTDVYCDHTVHVSVDLSL